MWQPDIKWTLHTKRTKKCPLDLSQTPAPLKVRQAGKRSVIATKKPLSWHVNRCKPACCFIINSSQEALLAETQQLQCWSAEHSAVYSFYELTQLLPEHTGVWWDFPLFSNRWMDPGYFCNDTPNQWFWRSGCTSWINGCINWCFTESFTRAAESWQSGKSFQDSFQRVLFCFTVTVLPQNKTLGGGALASLFWSFVFHLYRLFSLESL